ncbi:MAG TPA: hypothetical protein VH331_15870 [Allosphingosinicella sp.]|nr:hypothetical protein [Allosphingosinicella sp.]
MQEVFLNSEGYKPGKSVFNEQIYVSEVEEKIRLRIVNDTDIPMPNVYIDVNQDGQYFDVIDLQYYEEIFEESSPLYQRYFKGYEITKSGAKRGVWCEQASSGEMHKRKIDSRNVEYLITVPKSELSLSGTGFVLTVEDNGHFPRYVYRFRTPVPAQSLAAFLAANRRGKRSDLWAYDPRSAVKPVRC